MKPSRRTFIIVALAVVVGVLVALMVWQGISSSDLEILEAEFGVPGHTCTAGPDMKQRVAEGCSGFRPRCLVSVSSGWCNDRDPAPGMVKTLTVDYRCGEKRKRASAIEGTGLELSCP